MLFSLLKECPDLPSRAVRPDTATEQGSLDFCRKVKMPSLRITVGFLTNDDDWKVINEQSKKLANGIATGLIAWGNIVSPVVYIE
jgi:N-acetylmuramoyl-L-alanine amidase